MVVNIPPGNKNAQAASYDVLITAHARKLTAAFGDLTPAQVIANSSHGFKTSMAWRC
jgi:hypothetical protein